MKKLPEVLRFVEEYSIKYRNKHLKKFDISNPYDLFPSENSEYIGWPSEWPNNDKHGVYLIMDKEFNVIYIGESANIGKRLGNYFQYSDDKSCKIVPSDWSVKPKYICTIAVDSQTWFERLSLEEFLIYNTQPIDNKKSK